MKAKITFNDYGKNRTVKLGKMKNLPNVGNKIIDTDLTDIVKDVFFNFDCDEIIIYCDKFKN